MSKTIVITSGKGGVGKTNICVNTAVELSQRNYRTCLFDADFGLANVDLLLGSRPEYTLDDFIFGYRKLNGIILHSNFGIDIIPGSSGIEQVANLGQETISDIITAFSQLVGYDYFLIDTSSGISKGVIAFCLASSETIIVITSESTSLVDAYALVKVMASNGYKGTVKVLVNNCPDVSTSKRTYLKFKTAVDNHLNINIAPVGIVLQDPNFGVALSLQQPLITLFPNSIASQCIRSVVSILLKNDTQEDGEADFGEFWKRYFDFAQTNLSAHAKQQENTQPEYAQAPVVKDDFHYSSSPEDDGSLAPIEEDSPEVPGPSEELTDKNDTEHLRPQEVNDKELRDDPSYTIPTEGLSQTKDLGPDDTLQKTFVSSYHHGAIIDTLNLVSPTPLLSRCLDLQIQGTLSHDELLKIFGSDPALMVKALKMFSTQESISSKRVPSIHQIVRELEPEMLSHLLHQATMQSALSDPDRADTDKPFVNEFWYHSCKSAFLAQYLAEATSYPHPDEAYLAGLIHDIGRLFLQTGHPEVYEQFSHTFQDDTELLEIEKSTFGHNHAEIGAEALRGWHLNSLISDAVQYHTESESRIETAFDLVKIVFVASRLAQTLRRDEKETIGIGENILGLTSTQILGCTEKSEVKVAQIADHFRIPLTTKIGTNPRESRAIFRQQAMDYSLLQGVLPNPISNRTLPQLIRQIHQGLDILFGIKHALCLIPDDQLSCLQAVGYPNCFGWEILSDILLSFSSGKSFIVESFATNEFKIIMEIEAEDNLSLGDKQINRYLDSAGLTCIPMVVQRECLGVLVFGIQKEELQNIMKLRSRLEQFGAQSARNIVALEQSTNRFDEAPPVTSKTENDFFDILLREKRALNVSGNLLTPDKQQSL